VNATGPAVRNDVQAERELALDQRWNLLTIRFGYNLINTVPFWLSALATGDNASDRVAGTKESLHLSSATFARVKFGIGNVVHVFEPAKKFCSSH